MENPNGMMDSPEAIIAEATSAWAPIATAPRDGTVVIVFVPEWDAFHAAAFVRDAWQIAVRKQGLMKIAAPTKWKPLV